MLITLNNLRHLAVIHDGDLVNGGLVTVSGTANAINTEDVDNTGTINVTGILTTSAGSLENLAGGQVTVSGTAAIGNATVFIALPLKRN